jgi:hypothetical protein
LLAVVLDGALELTVELATNFAAGTLAIVGAQGDILLLNKIQVFKKFNYMWPSLFADFLSTNSLIHISKNCQNDHFPVRLFISEFKVRGPNWWSISTANNEGNLNATSIYLHNNFVFKADQIICDTL